MGTIKKNAVDCHSMKIFLVLAAIIIVLEGCASKPHSFRPNGGFVPDAESAKRIAEAVWIPIYGKDVIESEKPFVAVLKNDVWIVNGSLESELKGGVAVAEISKKDGHILRISHGK